MGDLEYKSEGEGEDSTILQRTREYFEDETPLSLMITIELNGCAAMKSKKKSAVTSPKLKHGR